MLVLATLPGCAPRAERPRVGTDLTLYAAQGAEITTPILEVPYR